ncbi:sensor histidine kinase [Kribbella sp. NPDC004536]|uniref:sensor histidine kinase n=1 Tax=Kribbella sp. NPDC004536 TaxID=3364106 RepID=UPI00369BE5E6
MWFLVALPTVVAAAFALAYVQARRAHTRALEERGWLLERERETAAQSAVDAERARIAHDLHDIVSHNVSVMVIQTGAARQVLATAPLDAEAAMLAVEAAGRDTMAELRHLLGVLAPKGDSDVLSPQPSLARLSELIDRMAFAGLAVDVRISGEACSLPTGVDVTAYRIIQEALTNALRHGDGVKAEVTVRYAEHALRVEVLNTGTSVLTGGRPPAPEGDGRGLLGLKQRVAVYGGQFDARRRLGGGFRVRAKLPLERP